MAQSSSPTSVSLLDLSMNAPRSLTIALALLSLTATLPAQEPAPVASGPEWEFTFVPYLWASHLDGTIGIGSLPEADVDASFSDLFENLDFSASAYFTARKGDWLWLSEVYYTALDVKETVAASEVSIGSDLYWVMLAGGYRLDQGPRRCTDVFAGARYVRVNQDASSTGGVVGSASKDEAWIDPVLGFHVQTGLDQALQCGLLADIGGFGVGSDLTWELLPSLSYRFDDTWALEFGYRWLDTDFEDSDFRYDMVQAGWILGLSIAF